MLADWARCLGVIAGAAAAAGAGSAAAQCRMGLVAELPVVMDGNQPLVRGAINGKPMLALADTGAFSSMVWRGAAENYSLPVRPLRGLTVGGVGGSREAQATTIKELKLGNQARRDLNILMAGWNRPLGRSQIAMILGQDILSRTDVELDFANGMIRLVKPVGCGPSSSLAYWGGAYAEAPLEPVSADQPHAIVPVTLNGKRMRAMLDTGAWTSVVTLKAAARAGVRAGSDKAPEAERSAGIGRRSVPTYVGSFSALQIGEQTVSPAKLRMADLFRGSSGGANTGSRVGTSDTADDPDMIIGADFFRSHRVLISYSQRRVVFSHNGKPIFQVEGPPLGSEFGPSEPEGAGGR